MTNTSYTKGYENSIPEDGKNIYCVYKLMDFMIKLHLPEGHQGKFFMQKARKHELFDRKSNGNFREASTTINFKNYTFDKYAKSFAIKCGFIDARRSVKTRIVLFIVYYFILLIYLFSLTTVDIRHVVADMLVQIT